MKAFLLAAGLGTRLRPITDCTPKCMLRIDDRPLLDIWLEALASAGVDEVLVNLHHLPEVVQEHLEARALPPITRTVYEPELLGSAGTLVVNRAWVEGEELFLACNADNLTDLDLKWLVEAHRTGGALATLSLFHAERPSECGIVEIDGAGRVTAYVEKPVEPTTDLANAGVYAFDPGVLDEIDGPPPKDIGYDLLPRLVGRARAVVINGYLRDIGTPDAYARAVAEWGSRSEG